MNLQQLLQSPFGKAYRRLHNVWLHDLADRMRMRRQTIARADGLDPDDVEHYPVSGDMTVVQSGISPVKAALAGVLLMLTGAGAAVGGIAAMRHLNQTPKSVPPVSAGASIDPTVPVNAQQFKVTFWADDGTPIDVQDNQ